MVFTSMNSSISSDSQNTNPWGYHLILDCMKCNIDSVTCPERIKDFCNDLINKIKMKPFGEPIIHRFAEHNSAAAGYSLIQLIERSNISAPFSELTGAKSFIGVFSYAEMPLNEAERNITLFSTEVLSRLKHEI